MFITSTHKQANNNQQASKPSLKQPTMAAIASKINALVATALQEAQTTTLDNFLAFLAKKEDVDMDFMTELITEFKATMPTSSVDTAKKGSKADKKTKKSDSEDSVKAAKRPPSAYNLFIKFAMTDADMKEKVMEKADPTQPKGRMLMKAAMELWAELHDSIKDKMKAMYKETPNMTGKELYDACTAWYYGVPSPEFEEIKPTKKPAPKKPAPKKPAPKKPAAKKAAESESEPEKKVADSDAEEDD